MTVPNTSLYILDNTGALVCNISSVQAPLSLVTQSGYSATLTPLPQVPLTTGGSINITAGNAATGYAPGSVYIQPGAAGLNNASIALRISNGANAIKITQSGTTPQISFSGTMSFSGNMGFYGAASIAQQAATPSYAANYNNGTSPFIINSSGVVSGPSTGAFAQYGDLQAAIIQINQLTVRVNALAATLKNLGITL